jgi:hypothetical protein
MSNATYKTEITVTLPDGKTQVFRVAHDGTVSPKGTSLVWTVEQWAAGVAKMRAAGATITETAL